MRRYIIFIIVVFLVVIGGAIAWRSYQTNQALKKGHSQQEILDTIVEDRPQLLHDGKPIIEIASFNRIDDIWYVVTVKSPNDKDMKVPVRIVIQDQGSSKRDLKTILGPEADFPDYLTNTINLPDSVIMELRK